MRRSRPIHPPSACHSEQAQRSEESVEDQRRESTNTCGTSFKQKQHPLICKAPHSVSLSVSLPRTVSSFSS